jgi:hypothetical protein
MKQTFEKATQIYEGIKKSIQEKWDGFKKKFEGTKSKISQEVINAKSPDDLIALGKKLQEQGETLKNEEQNMKQEKSSKDGKYETKKKEMLDADHKETYEINKTFNENKTTEEMIKEKARIAEKNRLETKNKTKQLAEIRAKLNGDGSEKVAQNKAENKEPQKDRQQEVNDNNQESTVENAEQKNTPEKKQYERFIKDQYERYKGIIKFSEDGELHTIFTKLSDNPIIMLEACKKNPDNIRYISERLSKDPEFVEQIKQIKALSSYIKDGTISGFNFYNTDMKSTQAQEKQEEFEKAKLEAIAFNLARGSRSLEEMGVDKNTARIAIKEGILKSLHYFGLKKFKDIKLFNNPKQIERAMKAIGGNIEEIINDPEIRNRIIEKTIPEMCNRVNRSIDSEKDKDFEKLDNSLTILSKTFKLTDSEWKQAMRSGRVKENSVHNYFYSPKRKK